MLHRGALQRWNTKVCAEQVMSFSNGFAATVALTVRSQSATRYVVPMKVANARIGSLSPNLEKAQHDDPRSHPRPSNQASG
jgi:hypothetical protein